MIKCKYIKCKYIKCRYIKFKYIKYKYNMRNDIGCKFLYDKTLIKIYDITGKICRTHNNWRIGAKRCFRGTCPERGGAGGEKRAS